VTDHNDSNQRTILTASSALLGSPETNQPLFPVRLTCSIPVHLTPHLASKVGRMYVLALAPPIRSRGAKAGLRGSILKRMGLASARTSKRALGCVGGEADATKRAPNPGASRRSDRSTLADVRACLLRHLAGQLTMEPLRRTDDKEVVAEWSARPMLVFGQSDTIADTRPKATVGMRRWCRPLIRLVFSGIIIWVEYCHRLPSTGTTCRTTPTPGSRQVFLGLCHAVIR
jgi:hypothetical protein